MILWLAWKKTVHLIADSAKVGKTEYAKEQKAKKIDPSQIYETLDLILSLKGKILWINNEHITYDSVCVKGKGRGFA